MLIKNINNLNYNYGNLGVYHQTVLEDHKKDIIEKILDLISNFFGFERHSLAEASLVTEIDNAISEATVVNNNGVACAEITVQNIVYDLKERSDGIYIHKNNNITGKLIKGTEHMMLSHLIADAKQRCADISPDNLKKQLTQEECCQLLAHALRSHYPQEQIDPNIDFFTPTARISFPHFDSGHGIYFDKLAETLDHLQKTEMADALLGQRSPLPMLTILPLENAPSLFGHKSQHVVVALIDQGGVKIFDSKTTIQKYPEITGLEIIRTGKQRTIDTKTCGVHSCREIISMALQLDTGVPLQRIRPAVCWEPEVALCHANNLIDAGAVQLNIRNERMLAEKNTPEPREDAVLAFDDSAEI